MTEVERRASDIGAPWLSVAASIVIRDGDEEADECGESDDSLLPPPSPVEPLPSHPRKRELLRGGPRLVDDPSNRCRGGGPAEDESDAE